MRFIIDHFIKAMPGRLANGVIEAQGEDPDDRWTLVVANNIVNAPLRRGEHPFHELLDAFLRGRVKLAEVQS